MTPLWPYLLIICQVYGSRADVTSTNTTGQCEKPSESNFTVTSNVKDFYDIDDVVTVLCGPGYRPSSFNITCVAINGLLQWNKTDQCIKLCEKPEAKNLNTTSDVERYYEVGEVFTLSCDTGYRPSPSSIECEDHNGTLQWNGTVQCIGQCGKPAESHMSNTSIEKESYDVGDMVTISCEPGYRPLYANITCVDRDGGYQWNETVRCIKLCKKPKAKNLNITSQIKPYYDIDDVVNVSCDTGYRPSSENIVCLQHNVSTLQWNVSARCLAQCRKPQIDNMDTLPEDKDYYNVNESVDVMCKDGYHPSQMKMRCVENKSGLKWKKPPKCIGKCTKPNITNMGKLSESRRFYNVNKSVDVECKDGYHPSHENMTCVANGGGDKWDQIPQCIGVTTTDWEVTSTSISFQILCTPKCSDRWKFKACCELILDNIATCNETDNKTRITFTTLEPYTMYRIITTLQVDNRKLSLEVKNITTNGSTPDSPNITQKPKMTDKIMRWELSDIRGKVTGFQLNVFAWRGYNDSFLVNETLELPRNVTEYAIPLQHGTNYTITLQGFTASGAGEVTTEFIETDIGDPPCHVENTVNDSTLQLFPVDDLNGPISFYEIIVYDGQARNLSCLEFRNDYNSTTPRHYTAAVFPAQNLTGSRNFTVGDDRYYDGFHNSPLIPEHNYTIYVRVSSQWKQVNKSSCAFAGFLKVAKRGSGSSHIMAGTVSTVVFLLILLILMVVWRSRVLRKFRRTSDIPLKARAGPGKKKDIPADQLLDVVKKFRVKEIADSGDEEEESVMLSMGRYQEYKELPGGLMHLCSVALSPENQPKNRYKKVLPYDDSRVVLRSSHSGSDYINASYVDGYKAPKFYIATQGPIPETVSDFWSMVWQENSSVIVMLTGLEEQNKVKCEQYWPEQSQTYGDITVSVQKINQTSAFTIRSFSLKKAQSTVQMMVEQIHYLRWPDHGVPKNMSDMVQLVELMNKCNSPGSGPVIVHCSAGIGRTGTFLALDILLKMARAVKKVNVFNCVLELRKKRVKMVQEKEQYIFLYDVLLETLLCGSTGVPVSEIQKHTNCMSVVDPTTNRNGFYREFQALEKITELYQIYPCKEGKKLENQLKNRNPDILPGDHWRPILLSALTRHGAPGYVNAVFVNSNNQNDILIATQLPMKQTLTDFWALVWDYKCSVVVMMQRAQDLQKNGVRFWPEKGETSYGAFKVRTMAKIAGNGYTASTLNLRKSIGPSSSALEVRLLQLDSWPLDQSIPENPSALISLVGEAEKCQQQMSGSHILVTCGDGADRSGLFCAGAVICDQIRSEGCLDVSQAVRSIRNRRHQFIPNVEQYTFCYALAQSYLDSFETYGNFK